MSLIDLSKRYLLNETEHRVLSCILEKIQKKDEKINIRSVAEQSYVSTTTVVKLSKKLGYQGYSDMIYSLRRRADEEHYSSAGIDLSSILETVDMDAIEYFADELYRCKDKCIFVVGLGYSTIISSYFMRRLATLGFLAYDGSPVDMLSSNGSKSSLTIILSKSGETRDLIDIATHVRGIGHSLITLTAHDNSTLANMSDQCLVIRSEAQGAYNVPDFFVGRSIILMEYVLSLLIDRIQKKN